MNCEELKKYKNMSIDEIDQNIVPDIEDMKHKTGVHPISMYFMKVGSILVKCNYAENGKSLEDCFLSYLEKKAMLLD